MDYEKKYKEALEWARKVMQGKVGFVLDEVLEKFPELKESESEDEKIRKALKEYFINSFQNNGVAAICGVHIKDVLAWLEKQDNKDVEIFFLKDQIESLHAAIKALKEAHKIELEKQDEQKPAWSEEDKKKISELKTFIAQCNGFNKVNRQKAFNLIDALSPHNTWKPSNEQINALAENIEYVSVGCTQPILKGLLEDLKKLREE